METILRTDAASAYYVDTELTRFAARQLEVKYPENKAKQVLPMADVVEGNYQIRYKVYDTVGKAKIVDSCADDLPFVDVPAKDYPVDMHLAADAIRICQQDLAAINIARLNGSSSSSIIEAKVRAAMSAVEREHEDILWNGRAALNITGALKDSAVTALSATGLFSALTYDQIVADLHRGANTVFINSNGAYTADTVVLPIAAMAVASTKHNGNTDNTALNQFLRNSGVTQVIPVFAAAAAGTNGRAMFFKRDPEILEAFATPVREFTDFRSVGPGLNWIYKFGGYVGGCNIHRPNLGVVYMDGVGAT